MKLIGLISDTHSCWDERFAIHFAGCDEIWHAGDIGDINVIRHLQAVAPIVRAVRGNIDHGIVARKFPDVQDFTTEGIHVWMTHIGGYPGRYSPGVARILRESKVDLMVSGHSHILKVIPDQDLDLLHINPGAAGHQGWQQVRTLVRLRLDAGRISDLEVIELARKALTKQEEIQ